MQSNEFDFVVVGSGGGSVPAALVMHEAGKRVLIIEKQSKIGGTSAFSGGVIWIPNNHHVNDEGGGDSHERSRTYLDGLIGETGGPGASPERRDAYIRHGADMIRFLEKQGMKFLHAHWPDYYDSRPGGIAEGRSLCAPLFDVGELGEWKDKLASFPLTADLPIESRDAVSIFVAMSTWRGKMMAAKLALRMLEKKLTGRELRGSGNALQGRLFQIALRKQIPIWTECQVKDLILEGGRVTGVIVERSGERIEVRANLGVLINAGGFSRNLEMREQYQPSPTSVDWTVVNQGDTGDMHLAMMRLGAAIDLMDESWWMPSSFSPDDGRYMGFHSPNDIGKPHCIVVDAKGQRFANESCAYMEFGQAMYRAQAVPAWAVFDSNHRRKYPWGMALPGKPPKAMLDSGYLKRFDTLKDLARSCGIDPAGLADSVTRFNGFAKSGVDLDFHRGESAYHNYYGDPTVKPNPNLAPIARAPFYAVALYPGDVGTAGGVVADEHARALREDGSVIPGLYVTGNSSAPVVGRSYPGAGASVGPSMTFGYIAARHAAGLNS
ncbi:MAG: FAD-binding protein [Novosphingobium sp.]